ncbi:glycosyltransferase family 4 protein [Arenibacter sp. M-2]|uniref:glycosyltransferase family 4 protein n=1 Tax=Arenibacter sp. M-2 TaxID=3053612 RepID=UPI00256FDB4B|nr:glycosyltransferase family 4 protein [Arenibacter sp. M-2]MDL5514664.1 glycosyltransferase family 4 protein [Arenibacter sp. M-2]
MKDKNILFIGPYSKKPKGGVAFVLHEYEKLYPNSYFVASTISKNSLTKLYGFTFGVIELIFLLLTKKEIHIVHIHGASYNSFTRKNIIFKISKWFNKKTIYHVHGAEYQLFFEKSNNYKKRKIADLINNADCIISLSESWKNFFITNFTPKRVEVIPNIIGTPSNISINKSNKGPVNFQFLGYIDKRKGVWLLLETLKEHRIDLQGKAIFNIAGNGEVDKLQRIINQYQLKEIVHFIGWVSNEEKIKRLQEADVYILPSYNEGLPISILEAMSYSLPIISTYVGGIPEVVIDKLNGLLIEPGNSNQLLCAIEVMVKNKKFRKTAGSESYKRVQPFFPKMVKKELDKLYNGL